MYHVSQNKTERPANKQSPSENNWSTKREEWRQRDLQNVIPNSFKEKEKNCSQITRIALTKREDIEAFCPHTTKPEYACYSTEWFEVVVALQTLISYSLHVDMMSQLDVTSRQRCVWSCLFAYIANMIFGSRIFFFNKKIHGPLFLHIPNMIFGSGIVLFDKKMLVSPCSVAISYCCRLYSGWVLSFVIFKEIK